MIRLEDVIRAACEKFARKLPTWIITVDDDPYLARHYIFTKDWIHTKLKPYLTKVPSVFVHEFKRGDSDREYHSHPWFFSFSIILAGGYTEERVHRLNDGSYRVIARTFRPGMINVIRDDDFHRVTLLNGKTTWTLFVAGGRTGEEWGFLDIVTREFITWKEHLARREGRSASGYSKSL